MNRKTLLFMMLLAMACFSLSACKNRGIYVTTYNDTDEKLFELGMVYGSGHYDVPRIAPHDKHVVIIAPLYENRLEFRFRDKNGKLHFPYYGPRVGYEYHGEVEVHVSMQNGDYIVRFDGAPVPTPGVDQPYRSPKEEAPHAQEATPTPEAPPAQKK